MMKLPLAHQGLCEGIVRKMFVSLSMSVTAYKTVLYAADEGLRGRNVLQSVVG